MKLILSLSVVLFAGYAKACPEILKNVRTSFLPAGSGTLCEIANEYQSLKNKMAHANDPGSTPDRFADVLGPRMINPTNWETKRKQVEFNPWVIYEPAPLTWRGWENGRDFIEEHTENLIATGRTPELTLEFIKKVSRISMKGLDSHAGRIRTDYDDLGDATEEEYSLTEEQASAIEKSEYLMDNGEQALKWTYARCISRLTPKEKKIFDRADGFPTELFANDTKESAAFIKNGKTHYCGYITYVPFQQVRTEMNKYINSINASFRTLATREKNEDPLLLASRAQRWFVSIHPFGDGNGRQSRFMMEFVLRSMGLPAPVLKNFDHDLSSTEGQWARAIGQGILKALNTMKKCEMNRALDGCQIVPLTPKAP